MKNGMIVLLRGVLHGMGREADCEICARRVRASADPGGEAPSCFYTDCSVVGAPADLPDGEYIARFEDHALDVLVHRGLWFTRGAASLAPAASFSA